MTAPPASRGTPSMLLMPRSTRSGLRTVAWFTSVRVTGFRLAATRPAKPVPSEMRTPCRTSSSMPLAAVATSWLADWASSSTAAVSAWSTFFTRSSRVSSSACSSSLDRAASASASMSRSRAVSSPREFGRGPEGSGIKVRYPNNVKDSWPEPLQDSAAGSHLKGGDAPAEEHDEPVAVPAAQGAVTVCEERDDMVHGLVFRAVGLVVSDVQVLTADKADAQHDLRHGHAPIPRRSISRPAVKRWSRSPSQA